MVQRKYPGYLDPKAEFDKFQPYRAALITCALAYRPGGAEYMALYRAVAALDEAAAVILGDRTYFHLRAH